MCCAVTQRFTGNVHNGQRFEHHRRTMGNWCHYQTPGNYTRSVAILLHADPRQGQGERNADDAMKGDIADGDRSSTRNGEG